MSILDKRILLEELLKNAKIRKNDVLVESFVNYTRSVIDEHDNARYNRGTDLKDTHPINSKFDVLISILKMAQPIK